MPIPNLLHPVPVIIQQKDDSKTFVDDNFREPIQQAARQATKTVNGQPIWGSNTNLRPGRGGPSEDSDGYVLFRVVDLQGQGITLQKGDRFIKSGSLDLDVYVTSLQCSGHWHDVGGGTPTLVKAFFKDREPGRQNAGSL